MVLFLKTFKFNLDLYLIPIGIQYLRWVSCLILKLLKFFILIKQNIKHIYPLYPQLNNVKKNVTTIYFTII